MDTIVKEARIQEIQLKNKHYRLIIDQVIDFKPGQYLEVYLKDKFGHFVAPRPYTISSINKDDFLELYIGIIKEGYYSTHLSKLKKGDLFFYKGPIGISLLDRINSKKIFCLAFGSGISTYRPLIHNLLKDKKNQVKLLYVNSHYDDMFYNEELRNLEVNNQNFSYFNLITKEDSSRTATDVFMDIFNKIENKEEWNYLISGPRKAVIDFDNLLTENKIKHSQIICD